MALTFESMSNALALLLFISIISIFSYTLYEAQEISKAKSCMRELDKLYSCIETKECTIPINHKIEIKNNMLFCGEYYLASPYLIEDAVLIGKTIRCYKGEMVKCEVI